MPEQNERDSEPRESHVRRRLRMAEELAAQMRAAPEQRQPPTQEDWPALVAQPQAVIPQRPAEPVASPPPQPPPIQTTVPLINEADWPLLHDFMADASRFRQLSIGDLLDGAFRLYRWRFAFLVAIAALLLVPTGLVQLLFQQSSGGQMMALIIQSIFLMPMITATLIHCVAQTHEDDTPLLTEAYRVGLARYPALLSAVLLVGLLIVIPAALIGGCLGLILLPGRVGGDSTLFIVVALVIVLLALPIFTRLTLINQAIVLEHCGAVDGLKRSWNLTSSWFWRTFWVSTCAGVLTYLIGTLPALAINFVLGLAGSASTALLAPSITIVISQVGLILALPLQIAIGTLLYFDLRIRREGYDLEMLARQAEVMQA